MNTNPMKVIFTSWALFAVIFTLIMGLTSTGCATPGSRVGMAMLEAMTTKTEQEKQEDMIANAMSKAKLNSIQQTCTAQNWGDGLIHLNCN